jgi:hypothetical protein
MLISRREWAASARLEASFGKFATRQCSDCGGTIVCAHAESCKLCHEIFLLNLFITTKENRT